MTFLSATRVRLLSLLMLALAPGLGGCTLILPTAELLSEGYTTQRDEGNRYSVERPPREGTPVVLVLDDGSEAAGRWRGRGPDGQVVVARADSLHTVDLARIVQIRADAPRARSRVGTSLLEGVLIDALWLLVMRAVATQ